MLHLKHEMQTIVTDVCGVCQFVTRLHRAKTAERIKMLFELNTLAVQGMLC